MSAPVDELIAALPEGVVVTGDPKGFLNGCKAWAQDGPMVATLYPHWYKAPPA